MPATVALARFDDLVARGLRAYIEEDPQLELVGHDLDHDGLRSILSRDSPKVAVVGYLPPNVRELRVDFPKTQVVVLAQRPTAAHCGQMIAVGAAACLPEQTEARDVMNAIHLASRGLRLVSDDASSATNLAEGDLTPREVDVLLLLQRDQSNAQIAQELHIGIETARTHVRNILRKLGVASRRDIPR